MINNMDKKRVMITGAAGYIGAMLVDYMASRDDVGLIFAIDKDPETELTKKWTDNANSKGENNSKRENACRVLYFQGNLANPNWEIIANTYKPEIIIHTAWQIREIYNRRDVSWLYNIVGSDKVFDFAFNHDYVKRLIHFSTVASYGASPHNDINYKYTESDILRESVYLYAEEKRITEGHLLAKYNVATHKPMVMILRPASITGPRLRYEMKKFSLQSALSGSLKKQGGILNQIVGTMTSFMPSTKGWLRQYVHEDDVVQIVSTLALSTDVHDEYEIYNLCPPGPVVTPEDMSKALGKSHINIPERLIQVVFAIFWHLTRGRVPTAPGVWLGYSYPIGVDGSKVTNRLEYKYNFESLAALTKNEGRYKK